MRTIVAFLISVFAAQTCYGWSEGGHHLIGVMAFDRLTEAQQREIIEALRAHPRFAEDFKVPEKVDDEIHWLIGRGAYWPDVARKGPYDRPDWHWQLGATLVIGKPPNVPKDPGPCPADATLDTKDLHIAQAIELCRRIWKDKSKPAADRAIALCWLGHLVGDALQLCHAGSLYTEKLFPEGDRGANSIPTTQGRNIHSLWDGLLGPKFDEGDIRRRSKEIIESGLLEQLELIDQRKGLSAPLESQSWLVESRSFAEGYVYGKSVLERIKIAEATNTQLKPIQLSEDYLKTAGLIARNQAGKAGFLLAKIWAEGLSK